jgi:hypothetical protein
MKMNSSEQQFQIQDIIAAYKVVNPDAPEGHWMITFEDGTKEIYEAPLGAMFDVERNVKGITDIRAVSDDDDVEFVDTYAGEHRGPGRGRRDQPPPRHHTATVQSIDRGDLSMYGPDLEQPATVSKLPKQRRRRPPDV